MMQSWGKDPAHPGGLTDAQRTQIVRAAQANGVVVDESHQEVDPNGNFRPIGHGLRNTMIVVGLAAATLATMGAAGAFSGAAGGAMAGSEAGALAPEMGMAAALPGAAATGATAAGAIPAGVAAAATPASFLAATPAVTAAGAPTAFGPAATGYLEATTTAAAPAGIAAAAPTAAAGAGMTIDNYLKLAGIGTQVAGSMMNANAANNATQLSAQQFQQQRQDQQKQLMAQFLQSVMGNQQNLQTTQAAQGIASTQLDPYAQAKALNAANIRASYASGYRPGQGSSAPWDTSAIRPAALAKANDQFQQYAAAGQPNVPITSSPSADAFRQQYLTDTQKKQKDLQDQIMAFLAQFGTTGATTAGHTQVQLPNTTPINPALSRSV
jgi:hypothetical protein